MKMKSSVKSSGAVSVAGVQRRMLEWWQYRVSSSTVASVSDFLTLYVGR